MSVETEILPTIEWGRGEQTLVFLHYFGGAADSWRWVVERMPDYRCITLNLPGFGGTKAPRQPSLRYYGDAVSKTLAGLELGEYTLIGHSMGGKIALQVALIDDHPPQRLVLIAPSPPTTEPMPDEEKERLLNNHPDEDNAKTTVKNATRQPLSDEQYSLAIKTHMIVDDRAWRWWLLEGMNQSIAAGMSQLNLPVTVLASQDDPVIPYGTIQSDVIDIIPNASLIATGGIGHLIPLEAADWVTAQLRRVTV